MQNLLFVTALLFAGTAASQAQESVAPAVEVSAASPRSPDELDQLLGPIALYPDALIALILPAATAPADVVLAARYVQDASGLSQLENRAWDDSVKSLTRYPEVLKWMDQNLDWTKQLGEAFRLQPADVMDAVQRLRARAQAAGSLVNSPQQQVVAQSSVISIVPVRPEVIYVPYYDPQVVYVTQPYYTPSYFGFSAPYATGTWLSYGIDWNRRRVCYVPRPERARYWNDYRARWSAPSASVPRAAFGFGETYFRPWTPPSPGYSYRASPPRSPRPPIIGPSPAQNLNSFRDGSTPETSVANTIPRMTNPRIIAAPAPRGNFATPSVRANPPPPPVVSRLHLPTPVPAPATVAPSPTDTAPTRAPRAGADYTVRHPASSYRGSSRSLPQSLTAPAFSGVPAVAPAARNPAPTPSTEARPRAGWNPPSPPVPPTPASPSDSPAVAPAASESPRPQSGTWNRSRPGR